MSEVVEQHAADPTIISGLKAQFGVVATQHTVDEIPTLWVDRSEITSVLRHLKAEEGYELLFDVGGIDERTRSSRDGQPNADFSVFYHLFIKI